jgi:hypothetical protein
MIKEAPGLMEQPRVGVRQFCLFEEVSTTKYGAMIEIYSQQELECR